MRGIRCAVAAILAAGVVTVLGAQPPRQQGGFGGGGGDLNVVLLTNTALQEELKVTDAQKEKFKPLAEKQADLAKKRGELFGKGGGKGGKGGKGGDNKEKFTEVQEEGKKLTEETQKVLDTELTSDQKKRLKQIRVQMLSVNAFADPNAKTGGGGGGGGFGFGGYSESQKATMKEVSEALKLTETQSSKIKEILTEHNKDRAAIRTDVFGDAKGGKGAFDQDKQKDFQAKSTKLTEGTLSKIADVLDDTQKKAWNELTGPAFDTSKLNQPRVVPKKD